MKKKVIFMRDGMKVTVSAILLMPYVLKTALTKKFTITIDLYDVVEKKATVTVTATSLHEAYNCLHTKVTPPVTATHAYVSVVDTAGIHNISNVFAIGVAGSDV